MRTKEKRFLSVLLAICTCLTMLLTGKMPVSAAYENTHSNTGNQAFDIVAVAQTQLGYTEGANKNNKYGSAFGANNLDWCAFFVSWCAKEAGISSSIIRRQGVASPFSKYFNIPNTHGSNNDYFPKPGDLVFYAQDGGSHYHVGIVETVNKSTGKITTIEGNSYQKSSESKNPHYVCRHTISYNASNVCCYGTPNYTGGSLPTEHTCTYDYPNTYYDPVHPHYYCYPCTGCDKIFRDTQVTGYMPESCTVCANHNCFEIGYRIQDEKHPHYNYYQCPLCWQIVCNKSETNYVSSCLECHRPGKPVLSNMKATYVEGEKVVFGWGETVNTTHYNYWLYVKNDQNEWETYEHTFYATSGYVTTLPAGEYRCLIQSYNSNYWEADGSDWLHTVSDFYYFNVVSRPEKPVLSDMKTIYADNETIICDWQDIDNTVVYSVWVYQQNASNEWEQVRVYTVQPSQESVCTMKPLPMGKYRCCVKVSCGNPLGDSLITVESEYYYFDVLPREYIPGKPVINNTQSSYVEGEEIIFEWEATENTLDYVLMLYYKNGQNEWKMYSFHAFTPPIYKKTLPVGEYRCYVKSRNVDSSNNSIYTDSDYYYFMVTEPQQIDSVDLRGTITSFGDSDGSVIVRLMQGEVEVAKTVSTNGTYCLEDVAPGDYTLVVSKANHVTRTYSLTVTDTDVTLDVKLHLIGDIDGNGKVNTGDVAKLNAHLKGSNKFTDEYMILCANVNGGSLNMGDTAALYGHIKGTRKLY